MPLRNHHKASPYNLSYLYYTINRKGEVLKYLLKTLDKLLKVVYNKDIDSK
uniref:Uncharacterized protein n=1 Tax=viral metagenome TaxID=1070528 RepID=A0A6M3LVR3_9ZZZZ